MHRYNLSLTYKSKIEAVRTGKCTQTIRMVGKTRKSVGDLVSFHGYVNGRGTPWTWRTPYMPLIEVVDIEIFPGGIVHPSFDGCAGTDYDPWSNLDDLAARDFISPPTGLALRDVLCGMHKIPEVGVEAQILRWDATGIREMI